MIPHLQAALAHVYHHTGDLSRSEEYARKALVVAQQMAAKSLTAELYELLSLLAKKQGRYQQAYDYHVRCVQTEDSIQNEANTRQIAQLQANYQVEKKQVEIELLKKEGEKAALIRNGIAVGLLATLLIGGLIVSRQRLKIRNDRLLVEKSQEIGRKNEQLAEQNHRLSEQSAELEAINEQLSLQSAQLSEQTEKLEELNQAKSTFFANISHEFRTPLTLILNNLLDKKHTLESDTTASAVLVDRQELEVMTRNARRLLQLINQLLDLSKIESGKMKLNPQDGDLKALLQVTAASFSSLAQHRRIWFGLNLPEEELQCRYDADKVEKILVNLLANAFKFTPLGGSVNLTASLDANRKVRLEVQDSGVGIPADQLEKVFDRFYQGKQYFPDEQGTGIGLALCKELAELHGGGVWAESVPGQGARFVVELPFVPIELPLETLNPEPMAQTLPPLLQTFALAPEPSAATTPPASPGPDDRPLVLVVEDNTDLRAYIRNHLAKSYRVLESENGVQGLELAQSQVPDLIVSDWMMPDMDGIELCRRTKTDERTSHIPFLLLTALATREGKLTGLETGADDYLTKPFDARELDLRIRNLTESRRKLRERFSREIRVQPSDISVTSTDEKFLQRVMKVVEQHLGDSDFNAEQFGREVGMSRMQLHRKLTALTGQSASDFIRTMRLKRAAQLFEGQAGNVTEIAYEVGFTNPSHFASCFREQFGMLPSEFINRQESQLKTQPVNPPPLS